MKIEPVMEPMTTSSQSFQNSDSSLYLPGWGVATYDARCMPKLLTLEAQVCTRGDV